MAKYWIRADFVARDHGRCYCTVEASSEEEAIKIAQDNDQDLDWEWHPDYSETISMDDHTVIQILEGDKG